MITEKIIWGNLLYKDGTVSKSFRYVCDTMKEFSAVAHKCNVTDRQYSGDIKNKTITVITYVPFIPENLPEDLLDEFVEIIDEHEFALDKTKCIKEIVGNCVCDECWMEEEE